MFQFSFQRLFHVARQELHFDFYFILLWVNSVNTNICMLSLSQTVMISCQVNDVLDKYLQVELVGVQLQYGKDKV